MAKTGKDERKANTSKSIKDEVDKALAEGGAGTVRIREDGAVCFGGNCVVIKPGEDGMLDLEIDPSSCGTVAGEKIFDHLIRTAGKGVRITVPSQMKPAEK